MATATSTIPIPIQPTMFRILFSIALSFASRSLVPLSTPPLGVHGFRREEQTERDETQVIDDVRRIEDAFAEVVEVVDDRQVLRQLVNRRAREAADPGDHPEQQKYGERHHSSHDLVLGQTRDEQAYRDEASSEKQEPQICGHDWF